MRWHEIARRQHGVVGRAQLRQAGLQDPSIRSWLRRGRLDYTEWPRVYRVPGAPITGDGEDWAAVLSTDGVLSHRSAARWWGFLPVPDAWPAQQRIDVVAPARRRDGVNDRTRLHRTTLPAVSVTSLRGLPITTRHSTLLDCLALLPAEQAANLFDRAVQQRWLTVDAISQRLSRSPGQRGNRQLRSLRDRAQPGAHSEAERLVALLFHRARIVGWRANVMVRANGRTYVADFLFERARLIVEVDGYAHHSAPEQFVADRRRQNALVGAGWTVLRFTWHDIVGDPDRIVADVRAAATR